MRLKVFIVLALSSLATVAAAQGLPVPKRPAPAARAAVFAHEEEWIVADIVGAMTRITRSASAASPAPLVTVTLIPAAAGVDASAAFEVTAGNDPQPMRLNVAGHIWAPETYGPMARRLVASTGPSAGVATTVEDPAVRVALTDLRVGVLLDEDDRLSKLLQAAPLSARGHESAALLIGALALRETTSLFGDVRPMLSLMTAHLAIANATRGQIPEGLDGVFARAVLTVLAGRQREALRIVDDVEKRAASPADAAWVQALRLRITGDWRGSNVPGKTLLQHLEYARALQQRRGTDDYLDYLDRSGDDETISDWARIGFENDYNLEAGRRFTPDSIDAELDEARVVWSRLHGRAPEAEELIAALNERGGEMSARSHVLEWSTWAPFHQRHLCQAIASRIAHLWRLGADDDEVGEEKQGLGERFGTLTLFPVVARWIAETPAEYARALQNARWLAEQTPELLTAGNWDYLLQKPDFVSRAAAFPLEVRWFTPAVPSGTAFDLVRRSLRQGCPRPPTLAQAHIWALERPYDTWTVLPDAWLPAVGKPTLAAERKVLGPLLAYDANALKHILDYIDGGAAEHIATARALCDISARHCNLLAQILLLGNMVEEARAAYDEWFTRARDRVVVSNEMTWLARYYFDTGNLERLAAIVKDVSRTGSARGVDLLAEFADRLGQHERAEDLYRHSVDRRDFLGAYLLRQAARTNEPTVQAEAEQLLRPVFNRGLQRVVIPALEAKPVDGIVFAKWGPRPAAAGLRPTDVIVGVDGWRVRTLPQYLVVLRLSYEATMTFTIWRDGRYQEIRGVVPQRWFGAQIGQYRAAPTSGETR